ncbi:hypothetical protein TNCV_3668691 [Trichonephila clavipes]|nr:hypothetical protein TNCV_3668691 [Trichonephila clavipes]
MNYTFQPPSDQEIFSLDTSTFHPHHSYNINKEIPSQIQHYATPPPRQLSYSYDPQKCKSTSQPVSKTSTNGNQSV